MADQEELRPVMMVDRYLDGEIEHDSLPLATCYDMKCFPHCDCRVLHSPEECSYCADQTALQEERARLDVSNTGKMNRRWACPADRDRLYTNQDWPRNRPKLEGK